MSTKCDCNISDRHFVPKNSNMFLQHLQSDDIILAYKEFTIADFLPADIGLNMPPYVSSSTQMKADIFFKSQQITQHSIVFWRWRETAKKLTDYFVSFWSTSYTEQIILFCTAMTNLYEQLFRWYVRVFSKPVMSNHVMHW